MDLSGNMYTKIFALALSPPSFTHLCTSLTSPPLSSTFSSSPLILHIFFIFNAIEMISKMMTIKYTDDDEVTEWRVGGCDCAIACWLSTVIMYTWKRLSFHCWFLCFLKVVSLWLHFIYGDNLKKNDWNHTSKADDEYMRLKNYIFFIAKALIHSSNNHDRIKCNLKKMIARTIKAFALSWWTKKKTKKNMFISRIIQRKTHYFHLNNDYTARQMMCVYQKTTAIIEYQRCHHYRPLSFIRIYLQFSLIWYGKFSLVYEKCRPLVNANYIW